MIQEIIDLLPSAVNRIHPPVFLAIAGLGLILGLVGARFSRAVISLSLVSVGTVIGLHMPKWFGWGIDPMGTAFGMAIVLGISGYVLTAMWEGILLATILAAGAGAAAWMKLAPHQVWQLPIIDWSQTALEITTRIRLSLPASLRIVLPLMVGAGATVGAMLMVIWQKLGRSLFYSLLGMSVLVLGTMLGFRQTHADWLAQIPQDSSTQGIIFCLLVILSAGIQWLLLPKKAKPAPVATSENKLHLNQFVANGPALRVKAAEARVLAAGAVRTPGGVRPAPVSSRIR